MSLFIIWLNIGFTLVLPLAVLLALFIKKNWRPFAVPYLAGMATMLVFQFIIRVPILQLVLPKLSWYTAWQLASPISFLAFLALTAGIFEEVGRHIVMMLFLKKKLSYADGLSFGLGHGWLEAMLLIGVNYVAALILMPYPLVSAAPGLLLAAGVERVLTMVLHVAWSLLVMWGIRHKKPLCTLAAVLTHGLVDFMLVYLAAYAVLPLPAVYGILAALDIAALALIICAKNKWNKEEHSYEEAV